MLNEKQRSSVMIEAMRGLAALLVLVSHGGAYHLLPIPGWLDTGLIGEIGVDLFFFLSGYLIWGSAERTLPDVRAYAIHRATRVLPLYLVALAAAVALAPWLDIGFKSNPSWESVLRHLTFTQDLNPKVSRDLNPVLWTLTHEVIFYAIVPLVWLARRWLWAFVPITLALAYWALGNRDFVLSPFFTVAHMFAIGAVCARYKVPMNWVALLVAAGLCALAQAFPDYGQRAVTIGLLIFVAMRALPTVVAPAFKPLAWVGVISYGLYITHYLIIELYGAHIGYGPRWIRAGLITEVFLVLAFGVPTLTYWLIERPGMTTLRRWLLTRRARRTRETSSEQAQLGGQS